MRALVADRIEPTALEPLLRSIVEATVALFEAETSSIALYDLATDRLVFRVAVGPAADGAIGLSVRSDEGIAGYVFTTSQALAIGDVRADPRFSQTTAEMTGFLPRSILAVPLADEISTLGVLEILDPQRGGTFGLHDLELAGSLPVRQAWRSGHCASSATSAPPAGHARGACRAGGAIRMPKSARTRRPKAAPIRRCSRLPWTGPSPTPAPVLATTTPSGRSPTPWPGRVEPARSRSPSSSTSSSR